MARHFARSVEPRRTLSRDEIHALLETSGKERRVEHFRDHTMYAMMIATGIRSCEARALRWGDVMLRSGPRKVVTLPHVKGGVAGKLQIELEVRVPKMVGRKLRTLRNLMIDADYQTGDDDPVFQSNQRSAMSKRAVIKQFNAWQDRAGFERRFVLHELRHTAIMLAYRTSGNDAVAAQRFARHRSFETTRKYLHATDDTMNEISDSIASMLAF